MENIKGNDLDRLLRDGGVLPVDLALDCTIQAARGLEAAHAQGIIHRDIKPGNLLIHQGGSSRSWGGPFGIMTSSSWPPQAR